jgi:hypothetical protein
MPLLSYFVVVGSALIGLLYLANVVLPHDTPIHINSKFEAPPPPRQSQHTDAVLASRHEPAMSFAAVPVGTPPQVEERSQKFNAPPAPVTQNTHPQKKRKPVPRKREWRDNFAQANSGWRDDRPWTDRRRRNQGWRDQGWRDPSWGGPGWR